MTQGFPPRLAPWPKIKRGARGAPWSSNIVLTIGSVELTRSACSSFLKTTSWSRTEQLDRCGPASRIKSLVPCTTRSSFLDALFRRKPLAVLTAALESRSCCDDMTRSVVPVPDVPIVYAASARRARGLRRAPRHRNRDDRSSECHRRPHERRRPDARPPRRMAQSHWLPDRREGVPLHRQARRHQLTRMGLTRPRKLRIAKARP